MRRWLRILLAAVALILLLAAVAALFGPGMLRDHAREWVRVETGRTLEIGAVNVNLLAASVEIRNVSLCEAGQTTPFVAWQRLYVALSPRSLWHRAPVVREIELDRPEVHIERRADGRFNFSDLLERKGKESTQAAADEKPARFSLNNLTIHGGRIEFVDRTLPAPVTHRVEGLELAVPFIGNLPYLADRYVQPLLQAKINGTPLDLKGELKPFADTQEYVLKLRLDGIDLPYYLGYVKDSLPVAVKSGRLDVDLDLAYRASAASKPALEVAGRLGLTALDLREKDDRQLLFLPLAEAQLAPSHPLERQYHLTSLTLGKPQVLLEGSAGGEWNVARPWRSPPSAAEPPPDAGRATAPLQLNIDRLRLQGGRLEFHHERPTGEFATVLHDVGIDFDNFTMAEGRPFKAALTLTSERQEQLAAKGQLTIRPFALDLAVDAKGLPLAAYQPYYRNQAVAAPGGIVDIRGRMQIAPQQPLRLTETELAVHRLELPLPNGEGFRVAEAALRQGELDLAANRFTAGELTFAGVDARFSRDNSGHWSIFDRSYPALAKLAGAAGAPPPPAAPGEKLFSWRIGRIVLSDGQLTVRDELPAEPAQFSVTGFGATFRDLAAPEKVAGSFELQGAFQKKGQFQASGTVIPAGPQLKANLQLRRIPLAGFAPYLGDKVRVVLVDGALNTRLSADLAKAGERWQGRVAGDLGVNRFYCLDAEHREDLLRWERLQVSGIDARLDPPVVKVAAVALTDYYARVLLDEQARLNFKGIFAPPPASVGPAEATVSTAAAAPAVRPEISIGNVTLQGGTVNFTDRHLPRPFTAEMLQLGGRIEGLSSVPGSRAEVDLRGRLRNESPLTIAGSLNPLADPLFLDLKLDFTDIELSPLSPYSGTYVGYLIERGKLNVNLAYLVENGKLTSTNKLFINQFTFGDKVESDKATSLPVRLAVALLKDRNGEIHLDIPVYGDLNDPQFSVWGVVWQIVKNLLVKAVTSPLALLGALAGGGEDFSAIVFPYGSAQLTAAEQAKLGKIAAALRDKPELKIEVKGYVDPDQDPESYRAELLQEKMRREKLIDLRKQLGDAAPADAAGVTVTPQEYPDYLWRVYKAADFPKPRNLVGMVKHLSDAELEKLLLAHTKIGTEELTILAQERAQTVMTALTGPGGIPRERVFLAATEITARPATEGASRSRVEFGMAVK